VNSVDTTASIPLTELEKDHLRQMFKVRLRVFCAGYAFITGFILKTLLPYAQMNENDLRRPVGKPGDYEVLGHLVTTENMFYILLAVFGGFALTTGLVLFFKRVYSLKKDLGMGGRKLLFLLLQISSSSKTLINSF
jgi:hypothetical protein